MAEQIKVASVEEAKAVAAKMAAGCTYSNEFEFSGVKVVTNLNENGSRSYTEVYNGGEFSHITVSGAEVEAIIEVNEAAPVEATVDLRGYAEAIIELDDAQEAVYRAGKKIDKARGEKSLAKAKAEYADRVEEANAKFAAFKETYSELNDKVLSDAGLRAEYDRIFDEIMEEREQKEAAERDAKIAEAIAAEKAGYVAHVYTSTGDKGAWRHSKKVFKTATAAFKFLDKKEFGSLTYYSLEITHNDEMIYWNGGNGGWDGEGTTNAEIQALIDESKRQIEEEIKARQAERKAEAEIEEPVAEEAAEETEEENYEGRELPNYISTRLEGYADSADAENVEVEEVAEEPEVEIEVEGLAEMAKAELEMEAVDAEIAAATEEEAEELTKKADTLYAAYMERFGELNERVNNDEALRAEYNKIYEELKNPPVEEPEAEIEEVAAEKVTEEPEVVEEEKIEEVTEEPETEEEREMREFCEAQVREMATPEYREQKIKSLKKLIAWLEVTLKYFDGTPTAEEFGWARKLEFNRKELKYWEAKEESAEMENKIEVVEEKIESVGNLTDSALAASNSRIRAFYETAEMPKEETVEPQKTEEPEEVEEPEETYAVKRYSYSEKEEEAGRNAYRVVGFFEYFHNLGAAVMYALQDREERAILTDKNGYDYENENYGGAVVVRYLEDGVEEVELDILRNGTPETYNPVVQAILDAVTPKRQPAASRKSRFQEWQEEKANATEEVAEEKIEVEEIVEPTEKIEEEKGEREVVEPNVENLEATDFVDIEIIVTGSADEVEDVYSYGLELKGEWDLVEVDKLDCGTYLAVSFIGTVTKEASEEILAHVGTAKVDCCRIEPAPEYGAEEGAESDTEKLKVELTVTNSTRKPLDALRQIVELLGGHIDISWLDSHIHGKRVPLKFDGEFSRKTYNDLIEIALNGGSTIEGTVNGKPVSKSPKGTTAPEPAEVKAAREQVESRRAEYDAAYTEVKKVEDEFREIVSKLDWRKPEEKQDAATVAARNAKAQECRKANDQLSKAREALNKADAKLASLLNKAA